MLNNAELYFSKEGDILKAKDVIDRIFESQSTGGKVHTFLDIHKGG